MLQKALAFFNTDKHQWYGWKDLSKGEVYSNIKLNDDTAVMQRLQSYSGSKIEKIIILQYQTSLMTFFIMDLMPGKLQYKQQKINTLNLNKNLYDKIHSMDYLIGFLLGYFLKEALGFIKRISEYDWDNRISYQDEWDFLTQDDLP
jgi:hypothetical protein